MNTTLTNHTIAENQADPDDVPGRTIWEAIEARTNATPDALFVLDDKGNALTYGAFHARTLRLAAGLANRGVGSGTVVSWQLPSTIEAMTVFAALSRLDAIQNPLIMMLREPEVEFISTQALTEFLIVPENYRGYSHGQMARNLAERRPGMQVLVTDAGLPDADPQELPALLPESDGQSVRWYFYTSGTTAQPKGARHRDSGLLAAASTFSAAIHPVSEDRIASVAPMAHVGGILYAMAAVLPGASLVICETFDPVNTTRQLSEAGVTLCGSGVPFIQGFLGQQRAEPTRKLFPDVKAFLIGGSSRVASIHDEARDELGGVGIVSGYGLTESPFMSWGRLSDTDHHHATAEGRPGPGVDAIIVAPDGSHVPAGTAGELRVKAPQLMSGYVDESLNETAFDEEGYFKTGDLAFIDDDGYLTISGRIKDVIIRNMENISAQEVESFIYDHPGVQDVAAISLPDEKTGERVCAVVVASSAGSAPSLDELCTYLKAQSLNPRKFPVQLEVIEELPRNAMGKIVKTTLQRRFGAK